MKRKYIQNMLTVLILIIIWFFNFSIDNTNIFNATILIIFPILTFIISNKYRKNSPWFIIPFVFSIIQLLFVCFYFYMALTFD